MFGLVLLLEMAYCICIRVCSIVSNALNLCNSVILQAGRPLHRKVVCHTSSRYYKEVLMGEQPYFCVIDNELLTSIILFQSTMTVLRLWRK